MRKTIIAVAAAGLAAAAAFTAQGQTQAGGWRDVDPENILVIETSKGRIIAELTPQAAPKTVERIKTLARQGLYDNRAFFRVIDDFMAQTGDPEDTGAGASALPDVEAEFSFRRGRDLPFTAIPNARGGNVGFVGTLPVRSEPDAQMSITADGKVRASGMHCKGVLGFARADDPNSGNSQFYLMRQKADALNGRYTAFGRVLHGLDVVRAIKAGDPQSGQVADPKDTMIRARILADLPADTRPKIRVQMASSPEFLASVSAQAKAKGSAIDICDLDIAVSVQ